VTAERELVDAQARLAEDAAAAIAGHEALWAWDIGNENSNCVIAPTPATARAWLARLTSAIRGADETALPTYRRGDPSENRTRDVATSLVEEDAAAAYTTRALEALRRAGCLGAMLWCYSDDGRALWQCPPLADPSGQLPRLYRRHRAPFSKGESAPSRNSSKRSRVQVTGPAQGSGRSPQPTNARCARGEELQRTDFSAGSAFFALPRCG